MKPHPDDKQFIWLQGSMLRLYHEVEPDAQVTGIAISVRTAEGTTLHYTASVDSGDINRTLITPEALAISRDFTAATINLTPEPAP